MFSAWIVAIAGIWMIVAPFAVRTLGAGSMNEWVLGLVAIVFGGSMTTSHGWERPLAIVCGIWLFASAFIPRLHVHTGLISNGIIVGILLLVAGLSATRHSHPAGAIPPAIPRG